MYNLPPVSRPSPRHHPLSFSRRGSGRRAGPYKSSGLLAFTRVALALLAAATFAPPLQAQITAEEYADRRARLAAAMPGDGVLIVRGGGAPEFDYIEFHQTPPLNYLTGLQEPDAALLIEKRGGTVTQTVFVRERNVEREIWEGHSLGTQGAAAFTGVESLPRERLLPRLQEMLAAGGSLFVTSTTDLAGFPGSSEALEPPPGTRVQPMIRQLQQLRGTKSDAELQLIRRAIAITIEAHQDAMRLVAPGLNEFEVEAAIEYNFRRYGAARPAFASIVGSGPNSTTLHYNNNDRFMQSGEMIVIDIGANYMGYSADVTRSLPVNGQFSEEQRHIYQTVRNAQLAAEGVARVGASYNALSEAAAMAIAKGLAEAGLIDAPDATYDCGSARNATRECMQYQLFFMHGLGHGIGLQVHDPDQFQFGAIGVNSVFTIEPGIYVRADVLDHLPDTPRNQAVRGRLAAAVAKYANIGVRIEDDYIVGADGLEWVSRVPREIEEVEAMMAREWDGPSATRREMIEWFRDDG